MKRLILSLLMVIGTQILSFSQNIYPKKILWENDTVLAITKPQLIKINRFINECVHLRDTKAVLLRDLSASDSLVSYWKMTAEAYHKVSVLEANKYEESQKINNSLTMSLERQRKKNMLNKIGVGIGGLLSGVLLGILLK